MSTTAVSTVDRPPPHRTGSPMNIVVRRRLAAAAVAFATATAAGVALMPAAQAADTISLDPNTAFNTETKTITITLAANSNGFGYPPQSTVTFTRQGSSGTDTFSKTIDPSDPTQPTVTVNFADVGTGVGG